MTELQLTAACATAFNQTFPKFRDHLYRIKNELDNHPRKSQLDKMKQLAENKATGVRNGIADFVLLDQEGNSIYIELKVGNNPQSPEQKIFQSKAKTYYLAYSVEDFINICTLHLL